MSKVTQDPFQGLNTKSTLLSSVAQGFFGMLGLLGKTKAGTSPHYPAVSFTVPATS